LNHAVIPSILFGSIFLLLVFRLLEDYGRAYLSAKKVVKKHAGCK
jgi:hypothetical protein